MDATTRFRRFGLVVASAAVVLGLVLYGALVVFGDDDKSDSGAGPGQARSDAGSTSTSQPARPGQTSMTTTNAVATTQGATPGGPAASTAPGPAGTPGGPDATAPTAPTGSSGAGTGTGAAVAALAAAGAEAALEGGLPPGPGATSPPGETPGTVGTPTDPDLTGTTVPEATDVPPPGDGTYDSEECVLVRQLLGLIDDAELRAAAQSFGCL